jgi:hypothetical protein
MEYRLQRERTVGVWLPDDEVGAVVAEDAGTSTFDDATTVCCTPTEAFMLPALWMTFTAADLLGDTTPRPGLTDSLHHINAPVLLIASPGEAWANRTYHGAAPRTSQLWELPASTPHAGGLRTQPDTYEHRVSACFAVHLLETAWSYQLPRRAGGADRKGTESIELRPYTWCSIRPLVSVAS